ncbi:NrsF family protein [Bradyrhizobium sp. BTAi1]|uniref:NrsF family protein n=1 Tax=Bradyrhizobium sp. (strain BTAi1 / ATCC BAA-1182) TaxID=288000 RepID=UPI0001519AD6|nr:putative membrane protein of unknown function [Bradyrhizobium sp. BTAi1]
MAGMPLVDTGYSDRAVCHPYLGSAEGRSDPSRSYRRLYRSALVYALHCTSDSLPFVAVWYGGTIVLCTLAGAVLRPRLLRW